MLALRVQRWPNIKATSQLTYELMEPVDEVECNAPQNTLNHICLNISAQRMLAV